MDCKARLYDSVWTTDESVGTNITWQIKQQSRCKSCSSCSTEKYEYFVCRKVSLFLAFDRDSSTQLKDYLLYLGFSRHAWQPSTLEQLSFSSIDSLKGSQVTCCAAAEPHFDNGSVSREKLTEKQHRLVHNY